MLLILFALLLLISLITIPIIWKLITFVIAFITAIAVQLAIMPIKLGSAVWNGTPPNKTTDSFWREAANDPTAMWIKGTDGRFFRYGLNLSDEEESHQVEKLNEFYRNHMHGQNFRRG